MTANADDIALKETLRARGQRVTAQRIVINRLLRERNLHVGADELLEAVEERLPNVSLPTVYSTLELFEELGLVRRVGSVGGRVLWDSRLDDHHHAACSRCGRVEDLDVPLDVAPVVSAARVAGFADARAGLVVTGLCRDCAAAGR